MAIAAIEAVEELFIQFKNAMDPELEGTCHVLLQKLAQTTAFMHKPVNLALDAMVQNCSSGRIVSALLNTGLR